MIEKPYPDNLWQTHWDGCFSASGHHNCAVEQIAKLREENETLKATMKDVLLGLECKSADWAREQCERMREYIERLRKPMEFAAREKLRKEAMGEK